MGYDINRFKSRLPNEIICGICFGVLDDPQEIIECGHMFCHNCIYRWLDDPYYNTVTCPICRRDICVDDIRPAIDSVRQYINRLRIRCDFDHLGCIADVRLEDYGRHYTQCPLNPRKPIKCHRGCGVHLPPAEMLQHHCDLDMCQDAIEWNDIFDYVRQEMKQRNWQRYQPKHSLIGNSYKKLLTFFTNWLADPRVHNDCGVGVEKQQQQQQQRHAVS
ncbi:E3 ubiquitin-protein ligase NRDP1 [Dermatophagoides farinae]|uniref:E3 ubiquitin-protein ligase NRDP1 n=1 Tax=Dermatophagoides farinae TaxID=6954 RepID=UPI003F631EA1